MEVFRQETDPDEAALDLARQVWDSWRHALRKMDPDLRCQHSFFVGTTGCGKTSALKELIVHDLRAALRDDKRKKPACSVVIIDPVNLIDQIVPYIRESARNVVWIDPSHEDSLPCLNLFETGRCRGEKLKTAHMIGTFSEICSGLLDQPMTPPMQTLFSYCARVLSYVDNPTLYDMMELLQAPLQFLDKHGVPEDSEDYQFFLFDVVGAKGTKVAFKDTVAYVRGRLHAVMADPIVKRLLVNRHTSLSLVNAINEGAVILVSTRKGDLTQDGARVIGKYVMTLAHRAMQERVHLHPDDMLPCMFYHDEIQNSLSGGVDAVLSAMLDEDRKYKLAVHIATTRLGHFSPSMGDAILSCTSTHVVGRMAGAGAGKMVMPLGRTLEELTTLPNYHLYVKMGAGRNKAAEIVTRREPLRDLGRPDKRRIDKLRRKMRLAYGADWQPADNVVRIPARKDPLLPPIAAQGVVTDLREESS